MEAEYRKRIQEVFTMIENAFEEVDPDVVECENAMGALTITITGGARCILSAQPSVQQLWLAMASLGTAYHFSFEPSSESWKDDKGRDIELLAFLEAYLKKATGLEIKI